MWSEFNELMSLDNIVIASVLLYTILYDNSTMGEVCSYFCTQLSLDTSRMSISVIFT